MKASETNNNLNKDTKIILAMCRQYDLRNPEIVKPLHDSLIKRGTFNSDLGLSFLHRLEQLGEGMEEPVCINCNKSATSDGVLCPQCMKLLSSNKASITSETCPKADISAEIYAKPDTSAEICARSDTSTGINEAGHNKIRDTESGSNESGTSDARSNEVGTSDARSNEAGTSDARSNESGTSDARSNEARVSDAKNNESRNTTFAKKLELSSDSIVRLACFGAIVIAISLLTTFLILRNKTISVTDSNGIEYVIDLQTKGEIIDAMDAKKLAFKFCPGGDGWEISSEEESVCPKGWSWTPVDYSVEQAKLTLSNLLDAEYLSSYDDSELCWVFRFKKVKKRRISGRVYVNCRGMVFMEGDFEQCPNPGLIYRVK